MNKFGMFLYRLVFTHYRIVSEAQLQEFITEGRVSQTEREMPPEEIEKCTELCCHCNGPTPVPTEREIQPLVGSTGCIITATGTCPQCKREIKQITKANHGFLFHKRKQDDNWEALLAYPPLWRQWLAALRPPAISFEP